jgi:hypothetical protein
MERVPNGLLESGTIGNYAIMAGDEDPTPAQTGIN